MVHTIQELESEIESKVSVSDVLYKLYDLYEAASKVKLGKAGSCPRAKALQLYTLLKIQIHHLKKHLDEYSWWRLPYSNESRKLDSLICQAQIARREWVESVCFCLTCKGPNT